jgi:hypothetical protein
MRSQHKKRGDDLDIVASTNEGGWDWRVIPFWDDSKGKNPLNPFEKFGKEIRDGKQVRKNQSPDHHSFDIDLDPLNFSFSLDT